MADGENKGYSCDVRDSGGAELGEIPYVMMLEIMPNEIVPGDTFQLTVGCAKLRLSCQNFNNLDNYRAFPDMRPRTARWRPRTSPHRATPRHSRSSNHGAT